VEFSPRHALLSLSAVLALSCAVWATVVRTRTALSAPIAAAAPALAPQLHVRPHARPHRRHRAGAHLLARVRPGRAPALLSRPGGRIVARAGARTEFGGRRVLAVLRRRGRWLGVSAPEVGNGRLAWVKADRSKLAFGRTPYTLVARLSRRELYLRRAGRTVRRVKVAVGAPGSPTPTGRFAVTDELPGSRYGGYYGCCVLALSAHQLHTPKDWTAGSRMAIHGTRAPGTVGKAASAGCLRARDRDLRALVRRVPVGTPVVIRR
jgi:hypothetical protein